MENISEYNGVLIIWDEDNDKRIYNFIDNLTDKEKDNIETVGEHEGTLTINWKDIYKIPGKFYGGFQLTNDNDWWAIEHYCQEKEYYEEQIKRLKDIKIKSICRIITPQQRYKACSRQKWRCIFCNEQLKFNKHSPFGNVVAHIDHIHPFSKRETYPNGPENINEDSNLQALCPNCNLKKNGKEIN